MDLVHTTFDLPPLVGPARPDASGLQNWATSTETPQPVAVHEQQKDHHLKHAHVASELLTSDSKRLNAAVVSNDRVMDKVFSYLENAQPGQLHTVVAAYFSKLMISLLKTHNAQATRQMAKRGQVFISSLLKHIDSLAISDLIVRILDSPDMDQIYKQPTAKQPTRQALELLANADILGGLADCFVRASTDALETALAESMARSDEVSPKASQSPTTESPTPQDALLGKHPLEVKSSDRPAQKPRSQDASAQRSVSPGESPTGQDESMTSKSLTANEEVSSPKPVAKSSPESMESPKSTPKPSSEPISDGNAEMSEASPDSPPSATPMESESQQTSPSSAKASNKSGEESQARRRRLREETMANVTGTILGLTERMLQLPELGCKIPDRLSVYASPVVIARLLDAGIYARCNGALDAPHPPPALADDDEAHTHRVEAFSAGCNSALMHALGLIADLLTSEANVYRDEDEEHTTDGKHSGVTAQSTSGNVKANQGSRFHETRKDGDKIVSTAKLEAELAARFERLAQMLDEGENRDATELRPLGSLRLKLAEFFVACIKQTGQDTAHRITALDVPRTLLSLFDKYRWSSMLHGVVTAAIIACLAGGDARRPGRGAWFDAGLIPWLMEVWRRNNVDTDTIPRWGLCGYMGHLIRIGTALKTFLVEHEGDDDAGLPDPDQAEQFKAFAEQTLMPAHHREAKPLCDENGDGVGNGAGDGDEGEEATDVLDIGGIQFVEGLSGGAAGAVGMRGVEDDEGEIKPVDTGFDEDIKTVEFDDLDHFGADDESEEENVTRVEVDHDIPAEVREKLGAMVDAAESGRKSQANAGYGSNKGGAVEHKSSNDDSGKKSGFVSSGRAEESRQAGDLKNREKTKTRIRHPELRNSVVENVDSSSEDEGSYEAFVDDRKDENNHEIEIPQRGKRSEYDAGNLASQVQKMSVEDEVMASGLDGVVTEIEEEGDDGENEVSGIVDDEGNSSDDEYESWEDASRVLEAASRKHAPMSNSGPSSNLSKAATSSRHNPNVVKDSEQQREPRPRQK